MVAVVSWNVQHGFWQKGLKEAHSVSQRGQNAPDISIVLFRKFKYVALFPLCCIWFRLLILLPYLTSSRAHAIDFWTVKDSLFLSFQLSLCMCPFFKSFDFDFICCSQDARTVVPFMWKPQINHLYSLIGILSFFMAPNSFEEWSIGFRFLYLHQHKKAFCCI